MRAIPPAVSAVVLATLASLAAAQEKSPTYEISPFVGYVFGGTIAPSPGPAPGDAGEQRLEDHPYGGVRAAIFPVPKFGVELELARVASAVSVRDLQCTPGGAGCEYPATLVYALALGVVRGTGAVRPYAALGGGVCRLTALLGREGGTRTSDRATASAAFGVEIAVSDGIAVRLDARGYATDIDGLDLGPVCTTFTPAPPGGEVEPAPCAQERWLKNAALSAGVVFRL